MTSIDRPYGSERRKSYTHVPPRRHLLKVRERMEKLAALGVEQQLLDGEQPSNTTLKKWRPVREQVDKDIEKIMAGLLGEWEPEQSDYDDEDNEGAFLS